MQQIDSHWRLVIINYVNWKKSGTKKNVSHKKHTANTFYYKIMTHWRNYMMHWDSALYWKGSKRVPKMRHFLPIMVVEEKQAKETNKANKAKKRISLVELINM